MSPKEKAKELIEKMHYHGSIGALTLRQAKQCALIAVNFAIEAINDCSVVAGYPLEEYKQIKEELLKL